jgi:stearoyl-CoA desaturase (Delta-9 desaturase)
VDSASISAAAASTPQAARVKADLGGWTLGLGGTGFILIHLACFAAFFTGVTWGDLVLCAVVYLSHTLSITIVFHRYFSHRTFKTSRAFQFVMAWMGCCATQKGPLWWAARHRHHHRTSDTDEDVHSPITHTLFMSHVGWIFQRDTTPTDMQAVKDLARYPELRVLNVLHWVPPACLGVACFLLGGWGGLVWGFCIATVLAYHATFMVNSVCHLWGGRRYATTDRSRNNWFVALLTMGEGWHNNHHHYMSSANQGFRWWEIDVSYYVICLLDVFGVVWDVRKPPRAKLLGKPPRGKAPNTASH